MFAIVQCRCKFFGKYFQSMLVEPADAEPIEKRANYNCKETIEDANAA
jgi:hypothetical protein